MGVNIKVLTIISFLHFCKGQYGGMVAITKINHENQQETPTSLSNKDLESVYGVVKNISHSKGSIIKSKEGNFEYRRSFTSKIELEVNSLHLQNIVKSLKENITTGIFEKSSLLYSLDYLENLVHQYDIGKKFVDLGGFKLVLSLSQSIDDDISNAAFVILSAAMQGNHDVQKYASGTDLLKIVFHTLNSTMKTRINKALLTLSALTRNHPEALHDFLKDKGLYILSNLFTHFFNDTKIQLRIIDFLRDMTIEFIDEHALESDSAALRNIKNIYINHVHQYSMCDRIINALYIYEEYIAREKIVDALKTMFEICEKTLKNKFFIQEIKLLMNLYNPYKADKNWYFNTIDLELKYYIFQDLDYLFKKLSSKIAAKQLDVNLRTEL